MKLKKRFRYNKKRLFIYLFFIMAACTLTLGYSLLSTTLSIEGVGRISKAVWNIHFSNVQITTGSVTATQAPEISNDTNIGFDVKLNDAGEFYEFTADIVNEGTIDAKIGSIEVLPELTQEQANYFKYEVTYSDGMPIQADDALNKGTTETIKVRFEYLEQEDDSLYPTEDVDFTFQVSMNYIQGKGNPVLHPSSFVDDSWGTIVAAIKSGNTSNYNVGDTKTVDMGTLGTHTLRIVNKSTPAECSTEGLSQTACGFVLEFADLITTRAMNSTETNVGGWPASAMRTYVNSDIYNAIPEALRNGITSTTVVSGHGSDDSANFTSIDKLYLLSPHEVWKDVDGYTSSGIDYYDTAYNNTRQLDYYSGQSVTTSNFSGAIKQNSGTDGWWLRSAYSDSTYYFFYVIYNGLWHRSPADNTNGVSPAFRIG